MSFAMRTSLRSRRIVPRLHSRSTTALDPKIWRTGPGRKTPILPIYARWPWVLSGTASSLAQSSDRAVPLADAIKAFNKEAANHYSGKDQTPITEEEVIAAI